MAHAVIIDQMRRNVRARGGSRCVLPDRPSVVYERFVVARRERWARASVVTRASPRPTRPSPPDPGPHLSTRDGDGPLHPRQVSRPPRLGPFSATCPRDPRRRGAKARMVPNDVRDGGRACREAVERVPSAREVVLTRKSTSSSKMSRWSCTWLSAMAPPHRNGRGRRRGAGVADSAVRRGLSGATEASRSVGSPPVAARSSLQNLHKNGCRWDGKHAQRRRGEATWRCSSGRAERVPVGREDVRGGGAEGHLEALSGRVGTGARGTNGRAKRRRGEAT